VKIFFSKRPTLSTQQIVAILPQSPCVSGITQTHVYS